MTLRLPIQYAENARVLRMTISIQFKWKRLQEILTVKNDDEEATLTFECDKGAVELAPGAEWTHGYLNGATAIATMNSIVVTKVAIGNQELFAHECRLEITEDIGKSARFDAKAEEIAEKVEKIAEAVKGD
ncbi:hypothetical protein PINS_up011022 [Pythium insidiosum]|nr:hypothetical protein PINS_up011022 [Pythium insidiosum]